MAGRGNHIWTLLYCTPKSPINPPQTIVHNRDERLIIETISVYKEKIFGPFPLLIFWALSSLSEPFNLQLLSSFQESRQLLLGYIYLGKSAIVGRNLNNTILWEDLLIGTTSPAYMNSRIAVRWANGTSWEIYRSFSWKIHTAPTCHGDQIFSKMGIQFWVR